MADLEKMILAKRENGFGGFMNYMTDKYGDGDNDEVIEMGPNKKNSKNKKRPLEENDDESNKKNKKQGMRRKLN